MTRVDFGFPNWDQLNQLGQWLDEHMPNAPLPEPQRWNLSYPDGAWNPACIEFAHEADAILFRLRWS
jgi:hypothetical protein